MLGTKNSTQRQIEHLKRLANSNGKRLTVDLDAASAQALKLLLEMGFGNTQADVIRRALLMAEKQAARKGVPRHDR